MSFKLWLILLLCFFTAGLAAVAAKSFDYNKAWKEIDQLQNNGLPKSMAAKVDSLYNAAVAEKNTGQQIRALIYQLKIQQTREEFSSQKAIDKVQEQLKTASFPASAIMHSMLAQLYWSYYTQNRWRFSQRTETIDFKQDDIATWDLQTIAKSTISEYQISLQKESDLQQLKLDDYTTIYNKGDVASHALRPTLFDFLAYIALDFYANDESGLTMPFEEFSISDTKFFQPAASFAKMTITSPDTLSLKFQSILLYQHLIRFHLNDQEPSALVEVDLDRLTYVYNVCSITKPEQYYEAALRLEQSQYASSPASAYATFKLASLVYSLAAKYKSEISEDYRWNYRDAMEICQQGINAYPQSYGGQSCSALLSSIKLPSLNLTAERYVLPQSPIKILLSVKNLSGAEISIYRIPYPSLRSQDYDYDYNWGKDDYKKVKELLIKKPNWKNSFPVTNEGDFRVHTYELALTSLTKGNYIIIASNAADGISSAKDILGYFILSSTELSYASAANAQNRMLIMNRRTGVPLNSVTVKLYTQVYNSTSHNYNYQLDWTGRSNAQGIATIPYLEQYSSRRICLSTSTDTLIINNYYAYRNSPQKYVRQQSLLFTDRAIYRPGQTIYLKGITFETDGEKYHKLLTSKPVNLTYYDVNNQVVEKKTLQTNEFGTYNCTFTAPQGVLTGNMYISDGIGSVSISVEEYKRPRFEVTIDKPKETFKLNQYVTVKGKALSYAGFPIDNAQVSYRISRQPKYPYWYWWWGPSPVTPQKEISHGIAQTDDKGEFSLTFLAVGDDSILPYYNPYFTFTVNADVTDISGETRSGSTYFNIGEKELILTPDIADKIDVSNKKLIIPVKTTNLSNEPVAVKGIITISRVQPPDHIQKSRLWNTPDRNFLNRAEFLKLFPNDIYAADDKITNWKILERVYSGKFDTPETDSVSIKDLNKWEPGVYLLEATASYKQQEVKTTRYFTVYNSNLNTMPYPLADWFVPVKTLCEPGETAKVLIGSSYDNVSVLYELEKDHVVVDSLRFTMNNEQRLFTLSVREEDRGSFYVHFTYTRDGRLYTHDQEITVPWTNKQIDFEYLTFRNKLLPGQSEEWRLKLKDFTGGKVSAELLASMYDASLDAFRSSDWSANIYNKLPSIGGWSNYSFIQPINLSLINYHSGRSYPNKTYDTFNWWGYYLGYYGHSNLKSISFDKASSSVNDVVALQAGSSIVGGDLHVRGGRSNEVSYGMDNMAVSDAVDGGSALEKDTGAIGSGEEEPSADLSGVQARTNFAETAFFYPELRTDENGDVSFSFTVPEALTRWKFRALALTKDLKIGTTENTTVTQKPLMVLPNAPRFFREGDIITFSAKVTSLDESDQSGNCQLFLFDAITMEPVDKDFKLTKAQQSFSVKKGESSVLNWDLTIPFGINAVTYRVVAQAGDFSDGEENTLPILTNRMLVTESLPLPVHGNSTKSFVFEKLKNSGNSTTLKNHKLTLEYTSNPAWYAVQALPYMMEYPYECNEQIFSRFYANSLASHIANSNPRIQRVFDAWKNTPNSAALLSNLEKNQELKSVILEETPWVLDAKNESQSKQRIGLLFDLNNMANQFNSALTKLQKNQNPSGAWPWFPGLGDSWWVTQYIVEGFGHLDHLGVTSIRQDSRIWNMAQKATQYIDRQILKDYEDIKKWGNLNNDNLGYMEMHYLYTRSYFKDIKIPDDVNVAVEYFKGQADKYWLSKDLFGQGLIALALNRYDKHVTPNKIIASLKEKALHNEELGMWWKNENWGWYWYNAPIETQSLLIEAFNDVAHDTLSIDDMRTWLLKNKQTTNWKTTKATAEACYALLLSGNEWLNTEKLSEITIGGHVIDPNDLDDVKVEAGTGYFKTSWSGSEITPQLANVTVTNPNRVASWGSLYWQYFEDLDKITPANTPLKLNKKLFIERTTDTGKVLEPISDRAQLKIGDKVIVRIELRSDRDMEYVHMKDMRSAGFEPINVLSRSKWQDGLYYYEATGDAATNFFIEYLPKGTFVFEYPLRVTNKGDFSNGITTIQCMYAPEFTSHSEGIRVNVK